MVTIARWRRRGFVECVRWGSSRSSPRRILRKYLEYYHGSRTHLALGNDTHDLRQRESADGGKVIALPMVGGLHHRRSRLATDKVLRNDTAFTTPQACDT